MEGEFDFSVWDRLLGFRLQEDDFEVGGGVWVDFGGE